MTRELDWTEEQVETEYAKHKNKKGWIGANDIRSSHHRRTALSYRKLMSHFVDKKVALDNELDFNSKKYKVCFEIEKHTNLIESKIRGNYFPDSVILHPMLSDIPLMSYMSDEQICTESNFSINLIKFRSHWQEIYEVLYRYTDRFDMKKFLYNYFKSSGVTTDDPRGHKYRINAIVLQSQRLIYMYKSLELGWEEIKYRYTASSFDELFVNMVNAYFTGFFIESMNPLKSLEKARSDSRKSTTISRFPELVKAELQRLSDDAKISHDLDRREYCKTLLENCIKRPWSPGFYDAVTHLEERGEKHFLEILEDYNKTVEYYRCSSDNIPLKIGLGNEIVIILSRSSDPRIQEALGNWLKAESEAVSIFRAISRRSADKTDQ